jgi:hypothetical protein
MQLQLWKQLNNHIIIMAMEINRQVQRLMLEVNKIINKINLHQIILLL